MKLKIGDSNFYSQDLENYIMQFSDATPVRLETWFNNLNVSSSTKETLKRVLENLEREDDTYKISFEDVTVEQLRTRIQTFNNLIVRLPRNTPENKNTSLNIFLDWKAFVQGAAKELVKNEKLFVRYQSGPDGNELHDENGEPVWKIETGLGTDGKMHQYTELYTDPIKKTKLVDYSYCTENGKVIHDRFDYWSVDDFK